MKVRLEIITSCSDTGRKMISNHFPNLYLISLHWKLENGSFIFSFLARRFRDHTLWFPVWTVWWFIYQYVFQTEAFAGGSVLQVPYHAKRKFKAQGLWISWNNILKGNEWLKSIWKIYKKYSLVLLLNWLSHWYNRWQIVDPAPETHTFSFLTYFKINVKHWIYVSDVSMSPYNCPAQTQVPV